MERWRQPVIPVKVEHDTQAYDIQDGHIVRGIKWTLTPDQTARIRQGYACLNCMEPFETPRREGKCPLCSYQLSDTQRDLERVDRGGEHVGPLTTLADERERMMFEAEARRYKPGSSIVVPGR